MTARILAIEPGRTIHVEADHDVYAVTLTDSLIQVSRQSATGREVVVVVSLTEAHAGVVLDLSLVAPNRRALVAEDVESICRLLIADGDMNSQHRAAVEALAGQAGVVLR